MDGLWAVHVECMASYGFTRMLYGVTRFRHGDSLGDPSDFLMLTNHSPDYASAFVNQRLYADAPMVRWALEHEGAASWSLLHARAAADDLSPAERRIYEFNRQHGVVAGYTISFPSQSRRTKGAIGLVAKPEMTQDEVDAIWEEHGEDIELANNLLHLKVLSLPHEPADQSLTARQREVLEYVADGKTIGDVAQITGLTAATVEKHLRLARQALNVDSTAQAVVKATFRNQVFVVGLEDGGLSGKPKPEK
ncbi:LuxR family transcriptional regulator [Litorisediminicola beolgyonensis]|uniref:LuxR family transcriptional regulator n=2 Tax=Litorisediminicola beolgyonensis TaxID=1173614 RepID=A0ABW3ZJZ6_9RHOB